MTRRAPLFFTLGALALAAIIGAFILLDEAPTGDVTLGGPAQPPAGGRPGTEPAFALPDPTDNGGGATAPTPIDVARPIESMGLDAPATEVVGRVITRSGIPLPDAVIVPFRLTRNPPFSSRAALPGEVSSGADGRFDLVALPAQVALGVEVRHDAHAPQLRESFTAEVGKTVDLGDIVLDDGMDLTGTVTDEERLPVPGARIALREVSGGLVPDPEAPALEVLTDQDGRYALQHLALRQYSIEVVAEGYGRLTSVLSLVLAASSGGWTQDFRLERADSLMGGVVIGPDERPLADLGVRLTRRQPGGNSYSLRTATTNEDGGFYFDQLAEGRYQFDLVSADWYLQQPREITAGSDDLLVRALPALSVHGQLVSRDGKPPGSFGVQIRPDGRTGAGLLGSSEYEREFSGTDPRGSFELGGLRPGSYRFGIRAEGFASTTSSDVIIGAEAGGADVIINLLRGGTLTGHITPAAEGVTVELRGDDYDPSMPIEATFPTPPIHGLVTTTDAQGGFRFVHVPPEDYVVSVRPLRSPPAHVHGVVVADEQRTDVGAIELTQGGAIFGNVLGADGQPRQGVRVSANGTEHHQQTVTDTLGGFRLDALPAGEYEVLATPPGLWDALRFEARQDVTVRTGEEAAVLLTLAERNETPR